MYDCNNCNEKIKKILERQNKNIIYRYIQGPRGKKGEQGPQGEPGPQGEQGPTIPSSNQGIFYTNFLDTKETNNMTFENPWFIPNEPEFFEKIDNSSVKVLPGIYQITMSGLIKEADSTHGAEIYLQDENGSAFKDLTFKLEANKGNQMYFTRTIFFRFENETTLQVATNIIGDIGTSNIAISDVNLALIKIHE